MDKLIKQEKPVIYEEDQKKELPIEDFIEEELKKEPSKDFEIKEKYEKEEIFKDIKSIDGKIAKLLLENGVDSIDSLRTMTIKDLVSIKGIKRRIAKKIKKEVTKLSEKTEEKYTTEFIKPKVQDEKEDKLEIFYEKKPSKKGKKEIKGFMQNDYMLYEKKIKTKSGKKRTVRFFSKSKPKMGKPIELPKGFNVSINKKTGVPFLKKKK